MLDFFSSSYLAPLAGGALIGSGAALLLLLNGRIAGISGIVSALFQPLDEHLVVNIAFVLGLILGPVSFDLVYGTWPPIHVETPWPFLLLAGLLVGFGTRMGSGCTSGHGVMGIARLSPRSLVAVPTFLAVAMLTVYVMNIVGIQ